MTAISPDPENPQPGMHWWFNCECGKYKSIRLSYVMKGRTKSCGCYRAAHMKFRGVELRQYREVVEYAMQFMTPKQIEHVNKLLKETKDGY